MHGTPIRVDHVGIAVRSIDDAVPVLSVLGCKQIHEEPTDDLVWSYFELGGASRLELVEPRSEHSSLAKFLDRRGPGLHHVTLEVADVDAVIGTLESRQVPVVDRAVRDGWTEAFVSPRNPTGTLFQLMEYHETFVEDRPRELFVGGQRLVG